MRARGINYDTGTFPGNSLTRKTFDSQAVSREMAVIAGDLHCDAVRISGREPERLSVAARHAADAGLEAWFSPFPVDLDPAQVLALFAECAQRAEAVRQAGADVAFVTGCEVSAFCHGFLPGDTYLDRLTAMVTADLDWWMSLGPVLDRVNAFLGEAAATVRDRFGGRVSYASGPWESVDWTPFDLVSIDAYRTAQNAATFRDHLHDFFAHGKPVAITEYGTCAYQGAGDLGGMAWRPPPGAVPDEDEQVRATSTSCSISSKALGWTPRYGCPSPTTTSPAIATSGLTAWSACWTRPTGSRRRSSTRWRPGTSGNSHDHGIFCTRI
ncbi:MAG: hypothetical protein ACRDN1_23385 [Trebonia sp.]